MGKDDKEFVLDKTGKTNLDKISDVAGLYGLDSQEKILHFLTFDILLENNAEMKTSFTNIKNDYDKIKEQLDGRQEKDEAGDFVRVGKKSVRQVAEDIINNPQDNFKSFKPSTTDKKLATIEALKYIEGLYHLNYYKEIQKDLLNKDAISLNYNDLVLNNTQQRLYYELEDVKNSIHTEIDNIEKEIDNPSNEVNQNKEPEIKEEILVNEQKKEEQIVKEPVADDSKTVDKNKEQKTINGFEVINGFEDIENMKVYSGTIEEFNKNFGIGFPENKQSLENLYFRVETSGFEALTNDGKINEAQAFKYYKALEYQFGKPASFDTVKTGIEIMDKAQSKYNNINIFKRALSHFGFFSDVTKQREDIDKMKETFARQKIDEKTLDDIRKDKINEFPGSVIDERNIVKEKKERYLNNYIKGIKASAENSTTFEAFKEENLKKEFLNKKAREYDIEGKADKIREQYRTIRDNMYTDYGNDCFTKANDEKFLEGLAKKGTKDKFLADGKKYRELHFSVDSNKNPNYALKMVKTEMAKNKLDYDTERAKYVKDAPVNHVKDCINGALSDLYKDGAFDNKEEMNNVYKAHIQSINIPQRLDQDKLAKDTNDLSNNKQLSQTKVVSQEKNLEMNNSKK